MKRNIITFIMIAVLTAPVLQAADCGSGTLSTVPERAQLHLPDSKSPVSECTIARYIPDDTVLGYNSGYTVGDRTVMFVDP
ncbi:MAG: hypothetical protein KKA42_14800, partial [candidate division Zixibacteria bacterium]|nr:hypothetical protein [candidate division Zixibacteria bacterium]